jgi:putative copper resistance protein D
LIEPLVLVRFIHFAATLLAGGTVCFAALLAEPALRTGEALSVYRRRADTMVWVALALAVPTGAAWLVLLAMQILGAPLTEVCLHGGAWSVAAGTRFGEVALLRLALALLLAALLFIRAPRRLQLVAVILLVVTLAFVGHGGAKPGALGDVYLGSDIVHLLAATVWLGALPAFALFLLTAPGEVAVQATRRFSAAAMTCVGALLATGLINAWNLVGSLEALTTTTYGRVLTVKLVLFAAMLGLAAVNRLWLTPRLPGAALALARNSLAEAALGLGVLLAVGVLGTLEPGAHAAHETGTAIPADAAFVHIHMPEVMADVMIEPGRTGPARAIVRVMREDGTLYPTEDVKLALDPPAPAAPGASRNAQALPDGTWHVGRLELTPAGTWTVRVIVARPGREPAVLDAPIVIAP